MVLKGVLLPLCAMMALLMTLSAVPVAAVDVEIGVGDYWEYEFGGSFEGLNLEGTYKLKVDDKAERMIGSDSTEVFIIEVTGSGDISGVFESAVVTGDLTITGTMVRLRSNFSLASNLLIMNLETTQIGMTIDMNAGTDDTFSPVIDDYVGDEQLELGAVFESESTVTSENWFNFLGFNESESSTMETEVHYEVVGVDVPVSTPAGDFACYKIEASVEDENGTALVSQFYYSDEVGNYVKIEGDDPVSGFADLELKSYSYSEGGGLFALFEDPMLLIAIAVVVAVVVLVVLGLALRKRGKAPVEQMPPPPPPQ